jgi:sortase A
VANAGRQRWIVSLRVWASRVLIVAGAIGLALVAGVRVDSALGARRAWAELEAEFAAVEVEAEFAAVEAPNPDTRDWSATRRAQWEASLTARTGAPLGRLTIPAVGLEVVVLDGTDELSLNRGVGRIEGTRIESNLGIAGHRDGFFRALRNVAERDLITVETPRSSHTYEVRSLSVVNPEDVEVLAPTPGPTLTLVTCHPFFVLGHAPKRFIVHAVRVETGVSACGDCPARLTLGPSGS